MKSFGRVLLAVLIMSSPVAFAQQQGGTTTLPAVSSPGIGQTATPPAALPVQPTQTVIIPKEGGGVVIQGGTLAGEALTWLALVLGAPLAGFLAALVVKLAKRWGVDISDANRARLQEMVENGLALAAKRSAAKLQDANLTIEVRNKLASDVLLYVQEHGADTLKALGAQDPNDPKVIEALQARIEKALNDAAAKV